MTPLIYCCGSGEAKLLTQDVDNKISIIKNKKNESKEYMI